MRAANNVKVQNSPNSERAFLPAAEWTTVGVVMTLIEFAAVIPLLLNDTARVPDATSDDMLLAIKLAWDSDDE
tara:strand:- start:124 stop:342 length:219 start_codon:yes stop_codon:yes gene_type:complete